MPSFKLLFKRFSHRRKVLRINNIAANTAFGRVVKLVAPKEKVEFSANDRDYGVLYELGNVLNGRNSRVYTDNQANKIREFFKNILGDYNGENGIRIEKAFGDTFIISGKDAEKLKALEEEHKISYRNVSGDRKNGKSNSKKAEADRSARFLMGKKIAKNKEDGTHGRPESTIELSLRTIRDGKNAGRKDVSKFGKFKYSSMQVIDKERKMDDSHKLGSHTVFRSVSYEEETLKL